MKWSAVLIPLLLSSTAFAQRCASGRTPVPIAKVHFEATPGLTPSLEKAITEEIKRHNTDGCELPNEMAERARDLLQQRGYFKALVQASKWKMVGSAERPQLELSLVMELGEVFRLDHIDFAGQNAFDAQRLRAAVPMTDGMIFDVEKMRVGLKNLRDLYCSRGYVNFTPVPNMVFYDERKTIGVLFDMDEGEQYQVGQLTLNGVEPYPGAGKQILEAWKPHIGQIYDCSFLFLEGKTRQVKTSDALLSSAIRTAGASNLEISLNNDTKTMMFHLNFPDPKY
jgi:hypothetical protein